MLLSYLWLGMSVCAILFGAANGTMNAVSAAVTEGASGAVTLCLGITGAVCLWSGLMEVLAESQALRGLCTLLQPLLRFLFPDSCSDASCAEALSMNFTANLFGLGNAATPAGLKAASAMARLEPGRAGNELCRLIIMNTASLQLIPTTVAAVRSSLGAAAPFDILPCVWLTSLCSVCAGLLAAKALERFVP